jgi:hypothetical protein
MGPSMVIKIWGHKGTSYTEVGFTCLMVGSSVLLLSTLQFTVSFQKKLSHGLDHFSTYQLLQDTIDGDKWIHVLMVSSSGRKLSYKLQLL